MIFHIFLAFDVYPIRNTNIPSLSAQLIKIEILTHLWTSEFDYFTMRKTINNPLNDDSEN